MIWTLGQIWIHQIKSLPGVTTEMLNAGADWFSSLSADEVRRRFRANLELTGGEAFGEDRQFAGPGEQLQFKAGPATLLEQTPVSAESCRLGH